MTQPNQSEHSEDFIDDYKRVINGTLQILYKRGNEDGKRFKTDNYIGMELENLKTNVINLLDDCESDVDKFRDVVGRVFIEL